MNFPLLLSLVCGIVDIFGTVYGFCSEFFGPHPVRIFGIKAVRLFN